MKLVWIILVTVSFFLVGCGGGNDPVNEGKDKPVPPKKNR